MRRITPSRKKPSAPIVLYDADQDLSSRCCICFADHHRLISPCQCILRYHQKCLLHYIRQKLLTMKNEIDFSQIKCQKCNSQIRFLYFDNTHYSCSYFCQKLKKNWCNKASIGIILLLVAIIALGIVLSRHNQKDGMVYYGLLIGISILIVILMGLVGYFIQKNFTYKEIVLVKVFQFVQLQNNSSSSDSPRHIASQTFEIIVDQEY